MANKFRIVKARDFWMIYREHLDIDNRRYWAYWRTVVPTEASMEVSPHMFKEIIEAVAAGKIEWRTEGV
jgi:hypothetical protein